jgi:ribonuclease HI
MNDRVLFTDGSVDPQLKIGVGAYLALPASFLKTPLSRINKSELRERVHIQRFTNTSSTQLEVQTVLWALAEIKNETNNCEPGKIVLFSDSQCVNGLLKRRPKLTAENFLTKKQQPLKHAALYHSFYQLHDRLGFEPIKVKGHSRASSQDSVHLIFSVVDREVRKSLKEWKLGIESFANGSLHSGKPAGLLEDI